MAVTLLDHVRDYLITQKPTKFRDPLIYTGVQPQATAPYPVWREPDGAPGPRQGKEPYAVETNDELVVSLFANAEIPSPDEGMYSRIDAVEFVIRSKRPDIAMALWKLDIRPLFYSPSGLTHAGWVMAGATLSIFVLKCRITRGLQKIAVDPQSWSYSAEITFEVYSTVPA
jgi:hypothetical protein